MIIREASAEDAPGIARVHVDSWRTAYKGIVADDFLANLSYESREKKWREKITEKESAAHCFVAEDQNEIIGFAIGGKERDNDPLYLGELHAIYLLATHQRHGMGKQLVQAVTTALVAQGYRTMLVWVLAENPARKFYEKMGGVYVREKTAEIGQQTLSEVAYGWRDITMLLK